MKINSMDATAIQPVRQNSNHHIDTNGKKDIDQAYVPLQEKKEHSVTEKSVIDAIEKANKLIIGTRTEMQFSIHEKTKEIMVKVIDSDTKEVIREIPREKILDMVAKIWEMAGILVDEWR